MVDDKKYESLLEKAERLEKQAQQIRHHVGIQQSWKDVSDGHRRLFLNNERGGYRLTLIVVDGLAIGIYDKLRIIENLSERGDPLSKKIGNCLRLWKRDSILEDSKILEKLLLRTMTEKEYFRYLNGDLPIAVQDGQEYYLPKLQKNENGI